MALVFVSAAQAGCGFFDSAYTPGFDEVVDSEEGGAPGEGEGEPSSPEAIGVGSESVVKLPFSSPSVCGDGIAEPGEPCDDGDVDGGDGCAAGCQIESGYACVTGSDGGSICSDLDECALGTGTCVANAVCSNLPGSYGCACAAGLESTSVTALDCVDIDECALPGAGGCDSTATCHNSFGGHVCKCNAGYEGDGVECSDSDECALNSDNCAENAKCINTPGNFECVCQDGYGGDGLECREIDECETGDHDCAAFETCRNYPGSFACIPNGQQLN